MTYTCPAHPLDSGPRYSAQDDRDADRARDIETEVDYALTTMLRAMKACDVDGSSRAADEIDYLHRELRQVDPDDCEETIEVCLTEEIMSCRAALEEVILRDGSIENRRMIAHHIIKRVDLLDYDPEDEA